MNAKHARTMVVKYAANVIREVTYYTPDRHKVTALGPVSDAEAKALAHRPAANPLTRLKNVKITLPSNLDGPGSSIPLFWALPLAVFAAMTLFGPFSLFTGDGFLVGVGAGMANASVSVGVCAGLYLIDAWLVKRETDGWAKYDSLVAEGATARLIFDDRVSDVANLIAHVEDGMQRLAHCGLSTDEHETQLVPLVEEAMLYASDCHRLHRELVKARQMLAGISKDDVAKDDELRRLQVERKAIEAETSTAFARWMDTRWKLEHLGGETHYEADLVEAKLAAARWNAEHRNGRN